MMTCFHRTRFNVLMAGGIAFAAAALIARPALADHGVSLESESTPRDVVDVVLTSDGRLAGRVVDRGGVPLPNERVGLRHDGILPQQTATDQQGQFHFDGLPQGVYDLRIGEQASKIRVWSPGAAPPSAKSLPTLVAGRPILRGQMGGEAALGVVTLGAAVAGVTVATFASEDGSVRTPLIQPAGSTVAGPFQAGQIDTGNTPIPSLRQVTLDTTGMNVDGIDLRELVSP